MVAHAAFTDTISIKTIADFNVTFVELARSHRNFTEGLMIRKGTKNSMSLCSEFLHPLMELVFLKFVLRCSNVLFDYTVIVIKTNLYRSNTSRYLAR